MGPCDNRCLRKQHHLDFERKLLGPDDFEALFASDAGNFCLVEQTSPERLRVSRARDEKFAPTLRACAWSYELIAQPINDRGLKFQCLHANGRPGAGVI